MLDTRRVKQAECKNARTHCKPEAHEMYLTASKPADTKQRSAN